MVSLWDKCTNKNCKLYDQSQEQATAPGRKAEFELRCALCDQNTMKQI